jgi:hypothetical protein
MSYVTSNPQDPGVNTPAGEGQQNLAYLVLSADELAKGFVRPVRTSYTHDVCGTVTSMAQSIAETYARNPTFYGSTWCMSCCRHVPVRECKWEDGTILGS